MSGGQTATISGFREYIAGSGDDFIREQSFVQSTQHGGLGMTRLPQRTVALAAAKYLRR